METRLALRWSRKAALSGDYQDQNGFVSLQRAGTINAAIETTAGQERWQLLGDSSFLKGGLQPAERVASPTARP
jgi:hypothetical protein